MNKHERLADKGLFYLAIGRAVEDYDRARGNSAWAPHELLEIAKSAAIAKDLSYDGSEVDDSVARAIVAMASISKPYVQGIRAVEDAWDSYCKHP